MKNPFGVKKPSFFRKRTTFYLSFTYSPLTNDRRKTCSYDD